MTLENVFNTCAVGPVTLPNRVAFPAWALNYANLDGTVSDKLMKFYTDLADGGCGLIFTGAAVVTADGVPFNRVMHIDRDDCVPGLKTLFDAIRQQGAKSAIQLVHYGRQSSTSVSGDVLMAPSAIPCPVMSQYDPEYKVREMTIEDIQHLRAAFVAAAKRAADAGVDIVEVHACHGYMLNEFLSPYSNKRTDAYGGNAQNRARLIVEIISDIRGELGDQTAICLRVSGHEFVEGGLVPDDFKELTPMFEQAGIDMISVAAGVYESMQRIVPPHTLGAVPHAEIAAAFKSFANVPVCAVGSILDLNTAESFLTEGRADVTAMGRAQMADPYMVNKNKEGKSGDVRKCKHCNSCTFWTTGDPEVYCAVNPNYKKPD